jgi:DNA-binding IclR family transcriptional regulator
MTSDNKHEMVLSMFKEGEAITPKDIAKAAGLTPMQVRNALQKLKDKGRVTWEEGGLYRLAKVVPAESAMPLVERAMKNAHPLHTIWMN